LEGKTSRHIGVTQGAIGSRSGNRQKKIPFMRVEKDYDGAGFNDLLGIKPRPGGTEGTAKWSHQARRDERGHLVEIGERGLGTSDWERPTAGKKSKRGGKGRHAKKMG